MSNSPPLKILVNQLWKPNFERQGISEEFRPFFIAYIGVEDQKDYNNVLATLVDKAEQDEKHTIVFDNSIPFEVDFDFMNMIKSELGKIDLYHLKNEDLLMFLGDYNQLFIRALQDVILLAIQKEGFANDSVRNNFRTTDLQQTLICLQSLFLRTHAFLEKTLLNTLSFTTTHQSKVFARLEITELVLVKVMMNKL